MASLPSKLRGSETIDNLCMKDSNNRHGGGRVFVDRISYGGQGASMSNDFSEAKYEGLHAAIRAKKEGSL